MQFICSLRADWSPPPLDFFVQCRQSQRAGGPTGPPTNRIIAPRQSIGFEEPPPLRLGPRLAKRLDPRSGRRNQTERPLDWSRPSGGPPGAWRAIVVGDRKNNLIYLSPEYQIVAGSPGRAASLGKVEPISLVYI